MNDHTTGLSQADAQQRLQSEGYNELPLARRQGFWLLLRDVLREPMLLMLLAGGVLYLLFGDLQEALILLVFASLSVAITLIQQLRTERVLEALRDLTSPRALVIRDGQRIRIAGREVARGDLIVLVEGDRVPADATLLTSEELRIDESLLTGESVPVDKAVSDDTMGAVFSGTLVVRGTAMATVTATGSKSQIGRIGQSLATIETEPPRLRTQTNRLVKLFGLWAGTVTVAVFILYVILRGDWLEAGLASIALGMSMLPEEFPLVLTVFMAMGAWRISRAHVLTRRAAAIESLGAATVLCTDKTGTLTENHMRVASVRVHDQILTLDDRANPALQQAVRCGLLASVPRPFDPMDLAFHELAQNNSITADGLQLMRTFGLQPELLAVTQLWRPTQPGGNSLAFAKGAPEAVASLCGFDATQLAALAEQMNAMAREGLRVLGLGRAVLAADADPASPREIAFEWVALVGLADPLRVSVPAAVREARSAGIRVVMITGDYRVTAEAIAAQAGLSAGAVLTGTDLATLDEAALEEAVTRTSVFARVVPEQKLRIVTALKARGAIVAMTGDGVNDAPALKAADIGIAMGGRGTDVAREAAAIVLLNDDFGSIVQAIRLGRRIYDNLRKAMVFILAVHVPIAGMALLPLLLGMPIIFGPIHIAFLEMIIDPVCSLVFEAEPEEADAMSRPPREPTTPLLSLPLALWGVVQGASALAAIVLVYLHGISRQLPATDLRALSFVTLVLTIVVLVYVNRSFASSPIAAILRPNRALMLVPLAVGSALALVLWWPPAPALLGFSVLPIQSFLWPVVAALALLPILEVVKTFWARRLRR
jgi:Ca2+-transporting ATPase